MSNQVAVAAECMASRRLRAPRTLQAKKRPISRGFAPSGFGDIIGENAALRAVLKQVETVASTESTVLIRGETGTGKELIARAVHDLSPRKGRTLVKLNCAAIPTGLLESELFGHAKGAFTGAICRDSGFELPHQGTLFLDEVGTSRWSFSPNCCAACRSTSSSCGSAARDDPGECARRGATHRDLAEMLSKVASGATSLSITRLPIVLPPVRERTDDIPRLVRHFTQPSPVAWAGGLKQPLHRSWKPWSATLASNVRELQKRDRARRDSSKGPTLQVLVADLRPVAPATENNVAADLTLTAPSGSTFCGRWVTRIGFWAAPTALQPVSG